MRGSVLTPKGVRNFGVVVPGTLYRSGILQARGVRWLREAHGVRRIVDLTRRERGTEMRACARHGVEYVKLPMSDEDAPDPELLARAVALLVENGPVLVHCWRGQHRTGLVVACYRVRVCGWTADAALREAREFGFYAPTPRPNLVRAVLAC